jgi:osmoprotectant transport system substrate-binding protein/osmoprotectant transport system permease protein
MTLARRLCGLAVLSLAAVQALAQPTLTVGSKRFTESYILGEIIAASAERAGEAKVVRKPGMGNTGILFAALKSGAIDAYPEYSGTIALELTKSTATDLASINRELAPLGLAAGVPLGFDNTYALAMTESEARRLSIRTIGELARHPELKFGLSPEFMNRGDGWPGLKTAYGLPFSPTGLDHGLAYEALAAGRIDVMDIYSTDAKIAKYRLRLLQDDRHYFPEYAAVLLYRADLPQRLPRTWAALQRLEGRIPAQKMIALNAMAELEAKPFADIAAAFLAAPGSLPIAGDSAARGFWGALLGEDFQRLTGQHLLLVFVSLAGGVLVGVPLGVWAARAPRIAPGVLSAVGVIQTVPSLALLAFLIPLLGRIGTVPALVALFCYSLLPIVRNTYTGLRDIPSALRESALALGLSSSARLRLIELPLAAPSILAGIKTSAVINVGTATIAAFIGAGGYGERIATGLALNDNTLLLAGAIPAAALALAVQWLFDFLDRWLIPAGMR